MQALRKYLLIFMAFWVCVAIPTNAMAQAWMNCDVGDGTVTAGKLWNTDTTPGGFCSATGKYHVFSQIVCNVVYIMNDALGRIYCSLQYDMASVLSAALTLYITVLGAQLLMGTAQLTVKEVIGRMLKAVGVWTFATYSYWGIGLAFNFFIDVMSSGVYWVLEAIPSGINHANSAPFCFDPIASSSTGVMGIFAMLDEALCNAVFGPISNAEAEVLGFFIVLGYNVPPILGLVIGWLWMNFIIMIRALLSFLLSISATAFLISMSPIFLSFMLFNSTYQFFENWLKYMISFTLQVIIIFAIVAMWLLITLSFIDFFNELADIVVPYNEGQVYSSVQDPVEYWAVCPYDFGNDNYGPWITCTVAPPQPGTPGYREYCEQRPCIPASAVLMEANLVYYLVFHLVTLLVVVYSFEALLKEAPKIAQQLAGPQYIPSIGMGFGVNKYGVVRAMNQVGSGGGSLGGGGGGGGGLRGGSAGMGRLADGIANAIAKNIKSRIGGMATRR
jgi:hypothetical protein